MKIKQMLVWNWKAFWTSLAVVMAIMLAINLLLVGLLSFIPGGEEGTANTTEVTTIVMSVTIGIVGFSGGLRFGGANGVSRRSVYWGYLGFGLTYSAALVIGFAAIDLLFSWSGMMNNNQIFRLTYGAWMQSRPAWQVGLAQFLDKGVLCVMGSMLGYFLGGAFYRLGKVGKIVLAAGVPALIAFFIPIVLFVLPDSVRTWLLKAVTQLWSFIAASPLNGAVFMLVFAAAFAVFSWLLIRRAPVTPAPNK